MGPKKTGTPTPDPKASAKTLSTSKESATKAQASEKPSGEDEPLAPPPKRIVVVESESEPGSTRNSPGAEHSSPIIEDAGSSGQARKPNASSLGTGGGPPPQAPQPDPEGTKSGDTNKSTGQSGGQGSNPPPNDNARLATPPQSNSPKRKWEDVLSAEAKLALFEERQALEQQLAQAKLDAAEARTAAAMDRALRAEEQAAGRAHGNGHAKIANFGDKSISDPPSGQDPEKLMEWFEYATDVMEVRSVYPLDRIALILTKFQAGHVRHGQVHTNANVARKSPDEQVWDTFIGSMTTDLRPHGTKAVLHDKLHAAVASAWKGNYANVYTQRMELLTRLGYSEEDPALLDQLKAGWTGRARDRVAQQLVNSNWESADLAQLRRACYSIGNASDAPTASAPATAPATASPKDRHQAPGPRAQDEQRPAKRQKNKHQWSKSRQERKSAANQTPLGQKKA